jgi:hypothetical protein
MTTVWHFFWQDGLVLQGLGMLLWAGFAEMACRLGSTAGHGVAGMEAVRSHEQGLCDF